MSRFGGEDEAMTVFLFGMQIILHEIFKELEN